MVRAEEVNGDGRPGLNLCQLFLQAPRIEAAHTHILIFLLTADLTSACPSVAFLNPKFLSPY